MKLSYERVYWKSGFPGRVDAEVAYKAVQKLQDTTGAVTPEVIVDAAKPKRSPLHNQFEWDDTEAARLHRLTQARDMMRAFHVVFKKPDGKESEPVRAFHVTRREKTDESPARKVYQSLEEILDDPVARADMLQSALSELNATRRKYRALNELSIVFRAIDDVMAVAGDG